MEDLVNVICHAMPELLPYAFYIPFRTKQSRKHNCITSLGSGEFARGIDGMVNVPRGNLPDCTRCGGGLFVKKKNVVMCICCD